MIKQNTIRYANILQLYNVLYSHFDVCSSSTNEINQPIDIEEMYNSQRLTGTLRKQIIHSL